MKIETSSQTIFGVKVVHVSSAHPWTDNRIHLREAATLARAGYDVTLVAVENEIDLADTGVKVLKIAKYGRLKRVVIGSMVAVIAGLRTRSKIFHLHDPELVWAIPLLRMLGKKVVYDAHEDLPAQVLSKHYLGNSTRPAFVTLARLIVSATKWSNHVIAATEKIAERYRSDRVSVIHNYPPLREADKQLSPPSMRSPSIVYVGGMSIERGAVQMVQAIGDNQFPAGWNLVIAGSASSDLVQSLKSISGWAMVQFHGPVSPHIARDLVGKAQIGIVVLQRTSAYLDSLPTKMFEYMAAGIPVIASDFPLWRSIIERFDCGLLVDETSPAAIASAVRRYADDPELLDRHGENARRAAREEMSWQHEEAMLLKVYENLRDR